MDIGYNEIYITARRLQSESARLRAQSRQLIADCIETYHAGAALAKVMRAKGGVLHIDYSGPISLTTIEALERLTLPARVAATGTVVNFENALTCWDGPVVVPKAAYPSSLRPSVIIVRPDQLVRSERFCAALADCDVTQSAWLPHHQSTALAWLGACQQR